MPQCDVIRLASTAFRAMHLPLPDYNIDIVILVHRDRLVMGLLYRIASPLHGLVVTDVYCLYGYDLAI